MRRPPQRRLHAPCLPPSQSAARSCGSSCCRASVRQGPGRRHPHCVLLCAGMRQLRPALRRATPAARGCWAWREAGSRSQLMPQLQRGLCRLALRRKLCWLSMLSMLLL